MSALFQPVDGCESCDKNVLMRAGHSPVYSFQFDPPFNWGVSFQPVLARQIAGNRMMRWINDCARAEAAGNNLPHPTWLKVLDPDQLEMWLQRSALDVSEEHAMKHIPPERVDAEPGLLLDFTAESIPEPMRALLSSVPFPPTVQTMLIDGNHRAYRHWKEKRSMMVYVMSVEDQHDCFGGINIGAPLWT